MKDAIEGINGQNLDGRNITVNEAQSRSGGGGFRNGGPREGGGGDGYSRVTVATTAVDTVVFGTAVMAVVVTEAAVMAIPATLPGAVMPRTETGGARWRDL
ncbi:unnamed protein product [Linum trigynum]|uniref:Uncharacterized protein n=1 Tax=Linum trigynum TaxID=586398 RepID=A0AAV2EBV6_9ROSI